MGDTQVYGDGGRGGGGGGAGSARKAVHFYAHSIRTVSQMGRINKLLIESDCNYIEI